MTIQQLVYFSATASHGSFNAAARIMHCSQPAVSDQVRRLERELGVALFRRQGRGVALTQAGRTFLGHAERVLAAAADASSSVGRGSFRRDEVVTIGMPRNTPSYPVADLVAAFHADNPDVRLRLPGQNSAEVAEAVRGGELEAGLVALPVDDAGLDMRPLFRDEVLYVSADVARLREPVTIDSVASAPLILYDAGVGFDDPTRRQLATRAQEAGLVLTPRFDVEFVQTAVQLAASGLGDTIAARMVTGQGWFPAALGAQSFAEPLYDSYTLVTRQRAVLSSGMRRLIEALEAWAADIR